MSDFTAKRRLYLGAGEYIEPGKPMPSLNKAESDRLLETGAIVKAKARKAELEPENKMESAPANKSRARKAKD
jgi:hypothetical protein